MAQMLVGGEWIDARSGETRDVLNPATGEIVGDAPLGSAEDARDAIDNAHEAFSVWSAWTQERRAEVLRRGATLVVANENELAKLLTSEQGKPLRESVLEVRRFAHTLEYYADLGRHLRGTYIPGIDGDRHGHIFKRPLGVVGAIVAWSFPVSLTGNKIAPALLAGNTVVLKPAETTPLTTLRIAGLLHEAGLPKGTLNVVTGEGAVVGQEIVSNPKVRKIAFTGSTETGKKVMATASETVKRITLGLGGSDPMIVCDDADLEEAVKAAAAGAFFNCGQSCLAVKRLYLFESIADDFIGKLKERVEQMRVGNGIEEGIKIGPLHSAAHKERLAAQVQEAVERGAKVLLGGTPLTGSAFDKGHFYSPTLLTDVPEDARVATEEVLGPALPVFRVRNMDEAIKKANNSVYGLGSSIWTNDLTRAMGAAEALESGYTWINSAQIVYDELPLGGSKQSGFGKEHGLEALEHYTETKSVVIATKPRRP
jgi:acyl-CoA reductase-like NAD-dependent aldehyde dehydrogenase